MKKKMKKRLLIPCITAGLLYGCSSQTDAPAVSAETQASEETTSLAETPTPEETPAPAETSAETGQEKPLKEDGTEAAQDTPSDMADEKDTTDETDSKTKEKDKADENETDKDGENQESEENQKDENTYVKTVKDAQPETFPGCTYGAAFEEFFTSPQWEYFESTDGQNVVEFTGECMYAGARTKARMQFVVEKDQKTVNTGALYYNSTPQTRKIITDSLNKIFEQYAKAHGIPYTLPAPVSPEAANTAQTAPAEGQQQNTLETADALPPELPENSTIHSGGAQAALNFAAWTNPDIGSWYSPTTGYYVIPFVDNAGNASIRFANENTRDSYAAVYYTDAVSAVTNDAGGLTYQGYIYTASSEQPALIGMVEVRWNSITELKSLSVKMINGNQTMDTSMTAGDYTYFGTVN